MDVLECIRTRRSPKNFEYKKIDKRQMVSVLEAANWAPRAGNISSVRYIVVDDEGKKEIVAKATLQPEVVKRAAVAIIVCSLTGLVKKDYQKQGELFAVQNAAAAVQNMLLAAHAEKLAGLWVGAFAEARIRKAFAIPDNVDIAAIVLIGHGASPVPRAPQRVDMSHITYFNEWNVKDTAKGRRFFPLTNLPRILGGEFGPSSLRRLVKKITRK